MLRKFNFDYDLENDSLYMYDPKSKSKASVEIDDILIDFNKDKELCGIELLGATKFFNDLNTEQINADALSQLTSCRIDIIQKGNFFLLKFMLLLKSKKLLETPVYVPIIHENSPALLA